MSSSIAVVHATAHPAGAPAESMAVWRWVPTLFFAEGLPATIVAALSAVLLKQLEVPNVTIAACVSGLTLPWTLRPLWSPLLELFGTKRAFIVATEALIGAALIGVGVGLATPGRIVVCVALFGIIAVLAATHDMAADGLYISALTPDAQRRYVGWLGVAFNAGKLTAQGLVLLLLGELGRRWTSTRAWQVVFVLLGVVMAWLALHHARALPPDVRTAVSESGRSPVASATAIVFTFFRRGDVAWLLALILLYRLAEGQVVRMAPLFLLGPRGKGGLALSLSELGTVYGALGGIAWAIGSVVGGWLASRFGERRTAVALCLAFNLPAVVYVSLAGLRPSLPWITAAIFAEQLAYGIGSVGLKLSVLAAARGPYQTAHCAFAGALSGLGAMCAGAMSGVLQDRLGYFTFFTFACLTSLVPLVVSLVSAKRRS